MKTRFNKFNVSRAAVLFGMLALAVLVTVAPAMAQGTTASSSWTLPTTIPPAASYASLGESTSGTLIGMMTAVWPYALGITVTGLGFAYFKGMFRGAR